MWISSGGHFEIQYGGHKERISSGPISENVRNILVYICAKFGACITKCTVGLLHCCTIRAIYDYLGTMCHLESVYQICLTHFYCAHLTITTTHWVVKCFVLKKCFSVYLLHTVCLVVCHINDKSSSYSPYYGDIGFNSAEL